ncbi:hypothetical protein RJ641_023819 [Dillenia turbinata]|uniref:Uncharacterized protein n=1 Tax=Dillenia turbinata TaxID=194707 RepID=A0AAN8UIH4_9MAGN
MPTFSPIALQTLLEPKIRVSKNKGDDDGAKSQTLTSSKPNHIFITPALYTTPQQAPIPPDTSAQSLSPSPYVVNRKRRDFLSPPDEHSVNRVQGFEVNSERVGIGEDNPTSQVVKSGGAAAAVGSLSSLELEHDNKDVVNFDVEGVRVDDVDAAAESEFLDPCDTISVASSATGIEGVGKIAENGSSRFNQTEFFDADEDFFSDGSVSNFSASYLSKMETELHSVRLNLVDEIEKRKVAEDALSQMRAQWQRVGNILSEVGLTFPLAAHAGGNIQVEDSAVDQLCQQVIIAKFVSEAMGRAEARAEAEAAAEVVLEAKEQEISRLRDRLQYYEAVNYEMSHRNQEILELARRKRQRRNARWRWILGSVGFSVALGVSVMAAYSYFLHTSQQNTAAITAPDASSRISNSA